MKIGVGYDSDPEQVRDLLLAVAQQHPLVLSEPAPFVSFKAFGDSALEFELGCIVRDVQQAGTVRSDLNFAILASFRQAGIDIPFPQRVVHLANQGVDGQQGGF
jgi:small-conductance mechanosensitive channel